jgi:hypothetical protein
MVKIKSTETLSNKQIDELFMFLLDKTNFKNKSDVNNLFWDIIYLRKLLNKSIKSRRSSKRNLRYNYIMQDNSDNIIACICYKYLLNTNGLDLWDLTIIIKPDQYNDKINPMLIKHFREHDELRRAYDYAILAIYIPIENNNVMTFFTNEQSVQKQSVDKQSSKKQSSNQISDFGNIFVFGLQDKMTYKDKYNIYYNFQITQEQISIITKKITTSEIISILLNGYNLDNVVPLQTTSIKVSRITKKHITAPDIKIITRDIYDIPEIQNLQENDYDFFKMYSLKYYSIFEYLINRKMSVHDFVMKRFFSGSLLYNENIYNLYVNIVQTAIKYIKLDNLKDKILNIDFIIKFKNRINTEIENILVYNLVNKYNNRLILTNGLDRIKYFNLYKNDIISLKQFVNKSKEQNIIKSISNNILISNNYDELQNLLNKNNKKYDCILISINYANLHIMLGDLDLICKTQTMLFTVLNSLYKLNKHGKLIICVRHGFINIPIISKLISLLCSLFNTNDFIGTINLSYLVFDNFKKLDNRSISIIDKLIKLTHKYEKDEVNYDDAYQILISNKFNYHLDQSTLLHMVKPYDPKIKILYDIEGLSIDNKLINNIITKYNKHLKKQNEVDMQIYKYYDDINDENSKNIIISKYLLLFENIKKYSIIDIENIEYLIKMFKR